MLEGTVNIYKRRNEEHIKHDKEIQTVLRDNGIEPTLHDANVDFSIADLVAWSPEVRKSLPVPYMHVFGRTIMVTQCRTNPENR